MRVKSASEYIAELEKEKDKLSERIEQLRAALEHIVHVSEAPGSECQECGGVPAARTAREALGKERE